MSVHLRPLLLVLIALKLAFVALDSTIRLYLGDSVAYLYGAMDNGRLPDDRSFTYSWLLRWLVWPFGDLYVLLAWQSLAGIGIALLLWLSLVRYFHASRAVATAAAVILAMEPAQLYYERMVLAETFGLLWFVAFYAACAEYLMAGRARWLVVAAALGLLAATFRLNYLPVALVLSLGVPLLRAWLMRPAPRVVLSHMAIALCAVAVLHIGYREAVALIFGTPPGYVGRAGFMQLGLVSPLVRPEHFERVGLPPSLPDALRYPLSDPDARMRHMWSPGGLVEELKRRDVHVDRIGRELSSMALRDDPWGLVRMGLATVENYFTPEGIAHALDNDLGRREIPPDVLRGLREAWAYDAAEVPTRVTVVSRYFEAGTWWLVACLFVLPPLSLVAVLACWSTPARTQAVLAALIAIGLALSHLLFVSVAFYRYLHPLPFFVLLTACAGLGSLAEAVRRRTRVPSVVTHGQHGIDAHSATARHRDRRRGDERQDQ